MQARSLLKKTGKGPDESFLHVEEVFGCLQELGLVWQVLFTMIWTNRIT